MASEAQLRQQEEKHHIQIGSVEFVNNAYQKSFLSTLSKGELHKYFIKVKIMLLINYINSSAKVRNEIDA